jgi:hypothetical protein
MAFVQAIGIGNRTILQDVLSTKIHWPRGCPRIHAGGSPHSFGLSPGHAGIKPLHAEYASATPLRVILAKPTQ